MSVTDFLERAQIRLSENNRCTRSTLIITNYSNTTSWLFLGGFFAANAELSLTFACWKNSSHICTTKWIQLKPQSDPGDGGGLETTQRVSFSSRCFVLVKKKRRRFGWDILYVAAIKKPHSSRLTKHTKLVSKLNLIIHRHSLSKKYENNSNPASSE